MENNKNEHNDQHEIRNESDITNEYLSMTFEARTFYLNEIKYLEESFSRLKSEITKSDLKKWKEREIKKRLKKLNEYLKEIREADKDVQKAVDDLLSYMAQEKHFKYNPESNGSRNDTTVNHPYAFSSSIIFFSHSHNYPLKMISRDIPADYQLFIYQLVYLLFLLHQKITLFLFLQADIARVMKPDFQKEKMSSNEFLSKVLPTRLSRELCLDCIEEVLKEEKGVSKSPSSAILSQLSEWNTFIKSHGKKGKRPIDFYDFYRSKGIESFKDWVRKWYWPDFYEKHKKGFFRKRNLGEEELDQAAIEQYNKDEQYSQIDRNLESEKNASHPL